VNKGLQKGAEGRGGTEQIGALTTKRSEYKRLHHSDAWRSATQLLGLHFNYFSLNNFAGSALIDRVEERTQACWNAS